jgi:putative transposase
LEGYDYTQPGAYFITLVTFEPTHLLGEIEDGQVRLSRQAKWFLRSGSAFQFAFLSSTAQRYQWMTNSRTTRLWHRNYYEHVIRNEADLARIMEYIQDNPLRWDSDRFSIGSQGHGG